MSMTSEKWEDYKERQKADRRKAMYPKYIWGGKRPMINLSQQAELNHAPVPFQGTAYLAGRTSEEHYVNRRVLGPKKIRQQIKRKLRKQRIAELKSL